MEGIAALRFSFLQKSVLDLQWTDANFYLPQSL
jgi:hypothetical protein